MPAWAVWIRYSSYTSFAVSLRNKNLSVNNAHIKDVHKAVMHLIAADI